MNVILDANAALELIRKRPAAIQIENILQQAELISVPDLFVHELTNSVWKYNRIENMAPDVCEKLLHQALILPDEFVTGNHLAELALHLGCEFQHSTYDLFYVALAKEYRAQLLTLDKKLQKLCKKVGVAVCEL